MKSVCKGIHRAQKLSSPHGAGNRVVRVSGFWQIHHVSHRVAAMVRKNRHLPFFPEGSIAVFDGGFC